MSPKPPIRPTSHEAIVEHLGANRYELMARRMNPEQVAGAVTEVTDQLAILALELPNVDESSKIDEAMHTFLIEFGYLTPHTPDESDDEARVRRERDDMVHDQIAQFAALRELSDADMLRYVFHLQAAIGDADSPVRKTNIMRGLDGMAMRKIDGAEWDRAVRISTVILASMVYGDYASRASLPAPLELVATSSDHEDYIDLANRIFTTGELSSLALILSPLVDNVVVINTALALACDMRRADTSWTTIIDAMLDVVNRVQHARREQGETLRVIK